MSRLLPLLVFGAFVISFAIGAEAQTVNLEKMRKSVVFIYGATPEGQPNTAAVDATGFLVQVPFKSDPKKGYTLLITARHVVDPKWAGCPPHQNPNLLFLRVNTKNFDPKENSQGVTYIPLPLIPKKTVFTSTDPAVDAAVLAPIALKWDNYDLDAILVHDFATADEISKITAGAQIVSAGLLPAFPGVRRNYPFFKFGQVSAIPDELVQVPCAPGEVPNVERLWFIAANLVPGNSGSPVVFAPQLFSSQRAVLIGLQSISFIGSDIAGMTPVQDIFSIMETMGMPDANLFRGTVPTPSPAPLPKKP